MSPDTHHSHRKQEPNEQVSKEKLKEIAESILDGITNQNLISREKNSDL